MSKEICVICYNEKDRDDYTQPDGVAISTINKASEERGDTLSVVTGDWVLKDCRCKFINSWYILNVSKKNSQSKAEGRNTRSSQPLFDFKTKCFFCGQNVTQRERNVKEVSEV